MSPSHSQRAPANAGRDRRNRFLLLLIAAIFLGSFVIAGALRFSGWRPAGMKNHGELLQPPGDLRDTQAVLADGGAYPWNPAGRTWRIALAPPAGCAEACVELAASLDTVWQLFGRNADHVHILWIGTPPPDARRNSAWRVLQPDPALIGGLPRHADVTGEAAGVPVYVVDPNGFVILRYAPGFDPGHLRQDMARLLKLK
ncbi:hypothetical protein [Luteimonas vadosa]|uniref:Thioredoxin domain-containing protein n=1 Tax=Luteimonas vadosa TaxID=1165507 RepID=A0ABP9DXJ9_9GAMM